MGYGTQHNSRKGSPALATEPHEHLASSSSADAPPPTTSTDGTNEEDTTTADRENEGWRRHLHEFYERNLGLFLVFSAQTFGSVVRLVLLTARASYTPLNSNYHDRIFTWNAAAVFQPANFELTAIDEHGGETVDVQRVAQSVPCPAHHFRPHAGDLHIGYVVHVVQKSPRLSPRAATRAGPAGHARYIWLHRALWLVL